MLAKFAEDKINVLTQSELVDELQSHGVSLTGCQKHNKSVLLELVSSQGEYIICSVCDRAEAKASATAVACNKHCNEQQHEHRGTKRQHVDTDCNAKPFLQL